MAHMVGFREWDISLVCQTGHPMHTCINILKESYIRSPEKHNKKLLYTGMARHVARSYCGRLGGTCMVVGSPI